MNLQPTTVGLIVVIAVMANVLVLAAAVARARYLRGSSRFAEVQGYVSSSYRSDEPSSGQGGTWLPGDEAVPADAGEDAAAESWEGPDWPGARSLVSGEVEPFVPPMEPFELPEPTTLEQRGVAVVDQDVDELADNEPDLDDPEEDEDTMDVEDEVTDAAPESVTADAGDAVEADAVEADAVEATEPDRPAGGPIGRDPLTGMLDASAFEEVMGHEEAREQRYGRPATVIVFELDGLTKLVDRLGAEPGDRIETALGDTIQRLARRADHVARLERGRYAVLLPETDEVAAINYVERIRRACDLWLESGAIAMRLAIGWASTNGDAGLSGAVRAATDRMRLEQRRNARGAGDVSLETEGRNGHEPAEAAPGI